MSYYKMAVRNACVAERDKKRRQTGLPSFNVKYNGNALPLTWEASSKLQGNRINVMNFNFFIS